jgi:MFS family permease
LLIAFPTTFALIREPALPPRPRPVAVTSAGTADPQDKQTLNQAFGGVISLIRKGLRYLRELASFREAAKWVLAQVVFWLAIGGISPFVTRYASMELGLGDESAITLFLYLVILTAIFAVPMGILGDRLGKKRVLAVALLVFGCSILVGSQVNSYEGLRAVLVVAGAANAATTALGFAFLTELLPKHRMGELTGFSGMTWSFAQPLGSVLAGVLADATGTLRSSLMLAGVFLLVSFAILLFVHPERAAARDS